jgi:hypothetical protein
MSNPIDCTSLNTRIVARVGAKVVPYIRIDHIHLDATFFIHGHILKHIADQALVFFFPGYANEIMLPNLELHLYKSRTLIVGVRISPDTN